DERVLTGLVPHLCETVVELLAVDAVGAIFFVDGIALFALKSYRAVGAARVSFVDAYIVAAHFALAARGNDSGDRGVWFGGATSDEARVPAPLDALSVRLLGAALFGGR